MASARRTQTVPRLALAIAALLAALTLAACGDDNVGGGDDSGPTPVAKTGAVEGELTISNWPGYLDVGARNTVAEFEQETGVEVDYVEDINDNAEFFGKLQPQLAEGQSGGRSVFVVTDWMAKQMYDLGYLQRIDHSTVPTVFDNLLPSLRDPAFDPGRKFSVPWQSGMTGLMVNTRLAPDVRSVNDLFDPEYKGKVTVLSEMRDTVPLVMKADGVDPEGATKQQWMAAIDKLRRATESGQIRRITGNDYAQDMTNENVVAAVGWSGDTSLIDNPDVEWRMPAQGCILWSDNMVIPVGAPNTPAALAWMDFVYRPEVQADIAAYVQYVTPVEGVKQVFRERGEQELADNPLIFPTEQFTADCSTQPEPPGTPRERDQVTEAFQDVVRGS